MFRSSTIIRELALNLVKAININLAMFRASSLMIVEDRNM